ncbi:hypothetical protein V2S66_01105 [Streptomyces sp. V4-01]|uniref:Adhesin domain-containing protein n=1 Tax=Actinacidiphila polyblastidii TaxID=3110430 RepID=A0ABU7P431_9ACTN|nr:hypothetical protein [Streptomyces sp. V4-01]
MLLVGAGAVALAVVLGLVLTGHGTHHDDGGAPYAAPFGRGGAAGTGDRLAFHTGDPGTVVLDGVSGRISVTADAGAHEVTGTFRPADGAAGLHGRLVAASDDSASGDTGSGGALTVRCADGAGAVVPCAGDLSLTLPADTGLRLRQTSGETVLTGLGGELSVSTASDRLTASGLRPARADFAVVSGSADVTFAGAPASLTVQETSAAATVRLPAGDAYAVSTSSASADVQVRVPQDTGAAAAHRIALQVDSGSLQVLPG